MIVNGVVKRPETDHRETVNRSPAVCRPIACLTTGQHRQAYAMHIHSPAHVQYTTYRQEQLAKYIRFRYSFNGRCSCL